MDEKTYDDLYNEGNDEGYNPYRQERQARERDMCATTRREQIEHRLDILETLSRRCNIQDNTSEITALRRELEAIEEAETAEFLQTWTREITINRRTLWNQAVKDGLVDRNNYLQYAKSQGWMLGELKKAIKLHNL